jgi:hypothetical protein
VSVISHGLSLSSDRNYQNIITDNDTSSETIPELKKDSSIQSGKWGVASWVPQSFIALKIKRWSVIIDQRMYQAIMKVKMENINYRNELYIYIYIKKKKEDATNVWEKGLSDCIAEMQSLACIFG